jgi:hypothetical protein
MQPLNITCLDKFAAHIVVVMRNVTSPRDTIDTKEYSKAPRNWPPHKRLDTCIYLRFGLHDCMKFVTNLNS